jgi:hypothetical protein
MADKLMEEFNVLLDDYKIHIQHEFIKVYDKIENLKIIKVNSGTPEPCNLNKFKKEVYSNFNNIHKIHKNINITFEIIKEKISTLANNQVQVKPVKQNKLFIPALILGSIFINQILFCFLIVYL